MKDKQTARLARIEMIERLRNLANELEAGGLMIGETAITLPTEFDVTQVYDEKTRKAEYSFSLAWTLEPAKRQN
jgi:hypothetical protein